MSLFTELKRRNVFRVGIAYAVAAWLLLQLTEVLTELLQLPPEIGRAVVLLVVIGFVPALIFAWAFELTPEGIKREKDVDRSASVTSTTGRKLDRAILVVLTVIIALLVIDRVFMQPADAPPQEQETTAESSSSETAPEGEASSVAIAVLPFVNMSSDPEQEFFSDGISEEILNVLAKIPDWRVAARTSSFQFKGQNQDVADIARQLNVSHVLEGSVRKAGDRIRVTAQLIEADSGYHLWSETFDRELADVFAIQDEISLAIANELRSQLGTQQVATVKPVDVRAYELFLKGRGLVALRDEQQLLESFEVLQAAIGIAPEYAPAMATLARGYAVLPWFSIKIPPGEARENARRWATEALALEPDNDEALSALSIVLRESDMDNSGALDLLQRALEVNPNSVAAHNFLGDLHSRSGDLALAMRHESRAAELDPLGPVHLSDLANVYLLMEDYETVLELSRRALEISPTFQNALRHLVGANFILGDLQQVQAAVALMEAAGVPASRLASARVTEAVALGDPALIEERMGILLSMMEQGVVSHSEVAFSAVEIGDFDLAGEQLLEAHAARDGTWTFPGMIRLPEQAPDSEPWQEFWALPGPAELAELRRTNGLKAQAPGFGDGAR
jgi:TolB-like protein